MRLETAFQTASEIPPGISPPDGTAIVARDQIDSTPENRDTCIKRFNCHAENMPSRKHKEYMYKSCAMRVCTDETARMKSISCRRRDV